MAEIESQEPHPSMGRHSFHVVGFDHLVLRVVDVEASLDFYCGALGLHGERVDEWRAGHVPFPSVRLSPTAIIDLFPAGTGADGHIERGATQRGNLDHLCVVIDADDLDAVAAEFPGARRAAQLFGAQGLGDSVYVTDPDGNTVELRRYPVDTTGADPVR